MLSRSNSESDTLPSKNAEASYVSVGTSLLSAHSQHESAVRQILPTVAVPPPRLGPSIATPRTYSFQETSLARQLHGACIESAYHLLLDPARDPHMLHYAFKISPRSRDRVRLAAAIRRVLERGTEEALDIWEAPAVRTGFKQLQSARNQVQQDQVPEADTTSSETEWLDSYDVQAYLECWGIHVGAGASFAEARLFEAPVKSSSVKMMPLSLQRPSTLDQYETKSIKAWESEACNITQGYHADWAAWNVAVNGQVVGMGIDREMTPVALGRRTFTVDVAKFVKGMSSLLMRRCWVYRLT